MLAGAHSDDHLRGLVCPFEATEHGFKELHGIGASEILGHLILQSPEVAWVAQQREASRGCYEASSGCHEASRGQECEVSWMHIQHAQDRVPSGIKSGPDQEVLHSVIHLLKALEECKPLCTTHVAGG